MTRDPKEPFPCPFCGEEAEPSEIDGVWFINCWTVNCPASPIKSGARKTREAAIALWNKRHLANPHLSRYEVVE
jgi:hypothetical protein